MIKTFMVLLVIILMPSISLCAMDKPATPATQLLAPPAADAVSEKVQVYRSFLNNGDLLDAHATLTEVINELPEGERKDMLQKDLYALNMKILFSRTLTANSTLHEVVPGDTLGKIAKENHTTVALIMKSNGLLNHIIRPREKLKIFTGTFSIVVDKSDNTLTLFANNEIMKVYNVATGKNNSTPLGTYKIETKLEDPTWFHAGAIVPPDSPDNILGTRWLGISYPGYGIHGTTIPESIGTQSTSGCVRMLNHDVEELYSIVPYGTEVEIKD